MLFRSTVYKWVDENGVTHYSDQPHENAEKVQVAQPQTFKAPRTPTQQVPTSGPPKSTEAVYSNCAVAQPSNEDTFPNATSVTATVTTNPGVRDGDEVSLVLDGTKVPNFPARGGTFTISPIDRGTHTLQALVHDGSGNVVCQSVNVTFTVLQPSILNPANPNFKR